jgi:AAA family ATP:ADP antiporter
MIGAMTSSTTDKPSDGFLESVFGLKRHEFVAVAWSFAYFFCVLSSYYILRPVREEMAVGSGPNTIPYLFIGTFVTMIFATSIFGWVASRYPRRVFLPWVYLFFISNILIFWFVFTQAISDNQEYIWLGRIFFVWVSVFNLFVVSVFWSFMADIYTREQGRRLFGLITSGGSIGALIGGVMNHEHQEDIEKTVETDKPLGGDPFAGLTHLFSSKYFLSIALMSLVASLLGTALYMFRAELIGAAIQSPDERTQFFSNMNVAANALALIAQMFLVKQVVTRFGIGRSLFLFPLASMIGFVILAFEPTLMAVAVLDVVRRGLGFGFAKPSTDMLYSVVTPEEKYKTKNAIDTAIYRGGDVVGTWAIKFMSILGLGIAGISFVMLPFAAISAVVALWLGRNYKLKAKALKMSGVE